MSEKAHLVFGLLPVFGGIALIWWDSTALIIPVIMVAAGIVNSVITIYRIRKGYGR